MNVTVPEPSAIPGLARPAKLLLLNAGDLPVRLKLATPDDCAKGMFFNGVLGAVKGLLGPEASEKCRAAGGEKKFIDFFNYPIEVFLRLSFTAADLLQASCGSYERAFHRLGKQATQDFLSTVVGKTLLVLAGSDPNRLLPSLPGAYRTCVTYGERKLEVQGPKRAILEFRRDFMPHPYHEGVLVAVMEAMGAQDVKVVGRRVGPLDVDYAISWT